MTGIYLICFIAFPAAILINAHRVYMVNTFLDKKDTNVVKGIATCFVILAHLTGYLDSVEYNPFLHIFSVMGGMGVLLFFFVSGYGLYKSYRAKKIDITFCQKRLLHMYIPCVVIQGVFYLIDAGRCRTFDMLDMISSSLLGAWFIDVILIQYAVFFLTSKMARGRADVWIALSAVCSLAVIFVFMKCGLNARWYNGLILFPFGMFIAYKEEKIIALAGKRWGLFFMGSLLSFVAAGAVFTYFKGETVWVNAAKTFSGMCLCLLTCIVFLRIKFSSKIMEYIGKRSLYFYLIHINLLSVARTIEKLQGIYVFYFVLLLTFFIVGIGVRDSGKKDAVTAEKSKMLSDKENKQEWKQKKN